MTEPRAPTWRFTGRSIRRRSRGRSGRPTRRSSSGSCPKGSTPCSATAGSVCSGDIAHRLPAIVHADRILALSRGRVEAVGPHAHVLETSPTYRRLHALQTSATPSACEGLSGRGSDPRSRARGVSPRSRDDRFSGQVVSACIVYLMAIHRSDDALICRLDSAIPAEPSRPQALRMRIGAAVVLFLAIQACVATWVYHHDPGRVLAPDSPSYEMSALALLVDGRFWTAPGSGERQIHRTPGYPALIAASYALFGHDPVVVIGIPDSS